MLENIETFGIGGHDSVFDSVVNHLDKMARPTRTLPAKVINDRPGTPTRMSPPHLHDPGAPVQTEPTVAAPRKRNQPHS